MSNPWSNITPGGVAFSRHDDTDEEETTSPFAAHPQGETVQAPAADEPSQQEEVADEEPVEEVAVEEVVAPAPRRAPVLAPGQWGIPATPATPAPAPSPVTSPSEGEEGSPFAQEVVAPAPVPPVAPSPVPAPVAPVVPAVRPTLPTRPVRVPSSPVATTPPAAPHPIEETREETQAAEEVTETAEPIAQEEVERVKVDPAPHPVITPVVQAPLPVTPPTVPTPATQAPATQAPATQAPATQAPATQAPVAPAPVVEEESLTLPDGSTVNTTTGEVTSPQETPASVVTPVVVAPLPPKAPAQRRPTKVTPETGSPVGEEWSDDDDDVPLAAEKKEKVKRRTSKQREVALTERDRAFLAFLTRYKYATYPQIAGAFATTPVALRQRFPRLQKEGLVHHKMVGQGQFGVWVPTEAGVRVSGLDLPIPTVSWATVTHTLGLVDIGVAYELAGETVVTEREIRAADTRDRPSPRMRSAMAYAGYDPDEVDDEDNIRLYCVSLGAGEGAYGHIPDMVLVREPHPDGNGASAAIELELNHKPASQWRKILRGYLESKHIGEVVYLTNQKKIATGIAKAATDVGAEHIVSVRRFHPSNGSVVPTALS